LKKRDGTTNGVDFSMEMSVTFPNGIEVPTDLQVEVEDDSFGAFTITGTEVDGQDVTITFALDETKFKANTYEELRDAVNSAGVDGKGIMKIRLPGLKVTEADENLTVKVNYLTGKFYASATLGNTTIPFAYGWAAQQSCSTDNSVDLGNGKDYIQSASDNNTIAFTLKASSPDTLDGDILINGDTEHDSVYSATVGDTLTYTSTYDVSSIKDKMSAIEEEFGVTEDLYDDIALDDTESVFTAEIEVPDALSAVWPTDSASYTLSGTNAFTITDVTKDGNKVIVTMTLNDGYTNYKLLRDAIKNNDNTSEVLTLTVAPITIPPTVDTNTNITVVGSVSGYMHSTASLGSHVEHFAFGWESTQDTDIPKDCNTPNGGGDGTDSILADATDKSQISATFKAVPQPVTVDGPTVEKKINVLGNAPDEDATFKFTMAASTIPSGVTAPLPSNASTLKVTGEGTAEFGQLKFTQAGTYVYTVTEENTQADGYTYDTTEYTVTYVVTEKYGVLSSTCTILKGDETADSIVFTNEYYKSPTEVTADAPIVTKNITGDTPDKDATFTFTMTADSSRELPSGMTTETIPVPHDDSGNQTETMKITGEGNADFGSLTFTQAGTYVYKVQETTGNASGYTYDTSVYKVSYVVTEEEKGTLSYTCQITKDDDDFNSNVLDFTNTYTAPITVDVPTVVKNLSGDTPESSEDFTFILTADTDDSKLPADMESMPMPSGITGSQAGVTITGEGNAHFGSLTFTEPGTYVYTVNEVTPENKTDGYTYSDTKYRVTYSVVKTNGQLYCTRQIAKNGTVPDNNLTVLSFTNDYQALEPVSVTVPTIRKEITGDTPEESEAFEFTLTAKDGAPLPSGADGSSFITRTITGEGTAKFGKLTFSKAGTYVYKVKEVIPDPETEGYTYDKSEYTLTYVISESTDDRQLVCDSCTIKKGDEILDSSLTELTFRNGYESEKSVTVDFPTVVKNLTGDTPVSDETFKFTLTAKDDAPKPVDENGNEITTATVTGEGNAVFGSLTFTEEGSYVYEVKETAGSTAGYTYDKALYTVTYTVKEVSGKLVCTRTIEKSEDGQNDDKVVSTQTVLTFTNEYDKPEATEVTANVPTVVKTISSTEEAPAETFTFTLEADPKHSTLPSGMTGYSMPMPSDAQGKQSMTKTVTGAGTFEFGQMTFSKAGTYVYKVSEVAGDAEGYIYDDTVYTVTYTVSETEGAEQLSCTRTIQKDDGDPNSELDELDFTNTYQSLKSVTADVPAIEKVIKSDTSAPNETFTFALTAKTDGAPMPTGATDADSMTVTITGEGTAYFGELTFTEAGTYVYKVQETAGQTAGYTYDDTVYTVTYTVTESTENNERKLSYTRTIQKDGEDAGALTTLTFTNMYKTPEPVTVDVPTVIKNLTGDTPASDETFKFTLTANEKDSTLPADMTAATMPMPAGSEEGNATIEITGEGNADFGELTFTEEGCYVYEVKETAGSTAGYKYDETVYTLTYTVKEVSGKLVCTRQIAKDDNLPDSSLTVFSFTNTYEKPAVTPITEDLPKVIKTFSSDTPEESETFTFVLTTVGSNTPMPEEANKEKILRKTIKGKGDAKLGSVTFSEAGTYVYTVYEEAGNAANYTYDDTVYTVTYEVEKTSDDILTCTRTIQKDGKADNTLTELTFTNSYEKPEEPVTPITETLPKVIKDISGDTPTTNETFTFTLTTVGSNMPMPSDADGKTLTKTINGTGEVDLGSVTFSEAGTYVYTVYENKGDAEGYTYADTVYTITYEVEKASDGTLSCTRTIQKNGKADSTLTELAFTNNYEKPEVPVTPITEKLPEVHKEITGETPATDETFTFVLTTAGSNTPTPKDAAGSTILSTATRGAGAADFGSVTFSEAGTYVYSVYEEAGNASGYTYDDTVYTVTYEVEKSSDGKLTCTRTIQKDGKADSSITELTFTNSYQKPVAPAAPITVELPEVDKVVSGDTPEKNETFKFTLTTIGNNTPMPEEAKDSTVLTKTIEGTGKADFGSVTFSEPGTYVYTVYENEGEAENYTYDDSVYQITYEVTEASDGTLTSTRTIQKDGKADSTLTALTFTNYYEKDKTVASITRELPMVTKDLTGDTPEKNETFRFVLTTVGSDTSMPADAGDSDTLTRTIEGKGEADFGSVTFDEVGTYVYTVYEEAGTAEGYTYDDAVYMVTYEVTESTDGQLECDRTIQKDGRVDNTLTELAFTNNYQKPAEPATRSPRSFLR
jgi:pilin isopeptide linkage protein